MEILRNVIFLLIAITFSSLSFADVVAPTDRVTNGVKIREENNSHSTQIGLLKPGVELEWIENVPHWRKVRLLDGRSGFVSKSFTRVIAVSTSPSPDLHIHFLNTGTGSCAILECPGANAPPLIVDCGSTSRSDTDLNKDEVRDHIQEILNRHSVAPNLVLSHQDRDHYNLIPHVLPGEVDTILQGGNPDGYTESGFPDWIAEKDSSGSNIINQFGANFHTHHDTESEIPCGEAAVFILTVNTGTAPNAQSLVLMVEYNEFSVIFSGDATGETEARAMANFSNAINTTVLTGSHHGADTFGSNGSRDSNMNTWADITEPEILIYQSGTQFGHPRCTVSDNYDGKTEEAMEHPLLCGEKNGNIFAADVKRDVLTTEAQYTTERNGAIVISTDGKTDVRIFCSLTPECEDNIPLI